MNRQMLSKLKFAPYQQIDDVPSSTGVYLICMNDAVIYVGSAKNIRARIKSHHKTADITRVTRWAGFHGLTKNSGIVIKWKLCDTVEDARILEDECISAFVPTLNWIESRENYIRFLEVKAGIELSELYAPESLTGNR